MFRLTSAWWILGLAALGLVACGKAPEQVLQEAKAIHAKGDRNAAMLQVRGLLQDKAEFADARLFLGLLNLEAGDFVLAEKELRRAQQGNADPTQILPALANALLMQGEPKKVLAETENAALSDPVAASRVLAARGTAHLMLHQKEDARVAFDNSLKIKPGAPEALVGQARILASERNWPEALERIERALQTDRKDADALMLKGDLLRASGKLSDAEQAYKALVDAHPQHVNGLLALVSLTVAGNRLDEASNHLASIRKGSPGNPMVAYFQGLIAFRKNDFRAARDAIGAVLKGAPNHLPSVLLGGAIEFALGSQELAQTRLKYVLDRVPDNIYARRVLAASYTRAGQTQKALETLEPAISGRTRDPAMLALAGEVYMQVNDFSKARIFFEKATVLDPNNARMRTGLGLSRLAVGEVEAATADLENASRLDVSRDHADVLLVATYLQRKRFDQALAAAQAYINKRSESAVGYNLMAAAYLGKQDENAARASLLKALEIQPTYVPAAANLAKLDLRKGDKTKARKRLEDILARDKSSLQAYLALAALASQINATRTEVRTWLESAQRENPGSLQPTVFLTRIYLDANEPKRATELVERALASAPNSAELLELAGQVQLVAGEKNRALATYSKWATLQPSALSYFRMASAQMANDDFNGAVKSLKSALEFRPQFAEAQLMLVDAQYRTGRIAEALKTVVDLQVQNARSPVGWIAEGDVHMRTKQFSLAVRMYEIAFAKEPSGLPLMRLHSALVGSNRVEEGEEKLRLWVQRNPSDLSVHLYLAEQLIKSGKHKEAATNYELLAKKVPDNVVVLNNLAWAYVQLKDKRAVATAELAFKLAPENVAVMDTLGVSLVVNGESARGVEVLRLAARSAAKSPDIRLHFVEALLSNGDRKGARDELERLLVQFPEFPNANAAFKLLEELRRGVQ